MKNSVFSVAKNRTRYLDLMKKNTISDVQQKVTFAQHNCEVSVFTSYAFIIPSVLLNESWKNKVHCKKEWKEFPNPYLQDN